MADPAPFVSRAGLKLEHALAEFGLDVSGFNCADFGANVGGFTECLLRRGAARVVALETGYGVLAWTLRNDARVVVMERTNALHAEIPADVGGGVDLVVIDMAWTPQRLAVPAALRWLKPSGSIVTLIKPHYEVSAAPGEASAAPGEASAARGEASAARGEPSAARSASGKGRPPRRGVLAADEAEAVLHQVLAAMPSLGAEVTRWTTSPLVGGKSGMNIEFLAHLRPTANS